MLYYDGNLTAGEEKMKISVITAVWNAESTVGRCVESARFSGAEHLVMDNCSTDRTVEIIKAANPAVRVFSEPDKGIYDAMSKGAARAEGDILAWLNADDYYLPGTLEKVSAFFAAHPETELLHGNIRVNGRTVRPAAGVSSFGGFRVFHPTVFVRREVFDKYGPFDPAYPICADLAFFMKAGRNGVKFTYLDETLTDFALGGVSTARRKATADEVRRILLENGYGRLFSNFWYASMRARAFAAAVLKRD